MTRRSPEAALEHEIERGYPSGYVHHNWGVGWAKHRARKPRSACVTREAKAGWDARHRVQYRVTHNGRI